MVHDMERFPTLEDIEEILDSPVWCPWKMFDYDYWKGYLNLVGQTYFCHLYAWLAGRHFDRMSLAQLHE